MNQTIGVDPSVSSAPNPTITVDNVTGNSANSTITFTNAEDVAKASYVKSITTAIQIVNGVVTPTLEVLLYDVLGVVDASIPNKDQNRAIKRLIRDGFDKAYMEILSEAYPDNGFQIGEGHALEPYENKYRAIKGIVEPA